MSLVSPRKVESPRIVQPSGGGKRRWLLWLLLLIAVFAAGWVGHQRYAPRLGDTVAEIGKNLEWRNQLMQRDHRIAALEEENSTLRGEAAGLEREVQIDREAMQKVQRELARHQDDRLAMEEELAFLRGLVSDGKAKVLLGVRDFRLGHGEGGRAFKYGFTVTHGQDNEDWIEGWVQLSVGGQLHGESATLPLSEIASESEKGLKMRFRHFQDLDGVLTLPAGFEPTTVILEVRPQDDRFAPTIQRYPWQING